MARGAALDEEPKAVTRSALLSQDHLPPLARSLVALSAASSADWSGTTWEKLRGRNQ